MDFLKSSPLASEGPGRPRKRYVLTEAGATYLRQRSLEMAHRFGEATRPRQPVPLADPLQESPELVASPSFAGTEALPASDFTLPVDVYESGEELVLQAEIAGVERDDLDVRIDNNVLTISGERKIEPHVEKLHRRESRYGRFSRSFIVPATVDPASIRAEYTNGLLKVTLAQPAEIRLQGWIEGEVTKITPRDQDVLRLLAQGASHEEIARQLNISLYTVRQHVRRVFARAGIQSGVAGRSVNVAAGIQVKLKETAG